MRRALVSVTDKSGLVDLRPLVAVDFEFASTGGTAEALEKLGMSVIPVEAVTGFPAIMDGRLKTLHHKIEGGILADRSKPHHLEVAKKHRIKLIDLVVVNLYNFKDNPGIEQIDIGGSTMLRAAAKNFGYVTVVVDPSDYQRVVREILQNGETSLQTRRDLAHKAFKHSAEYDTMIAAWGGWKVENPEETLTLGSKH